MPKFEEAAEFIREKIRSGEWQPGDKIPSQKAWERGEPGLKVLYGTLRSAYIGLRTEGWITGEHGVGVYVAEEPPESPSNKTKSKLQKAFGEGLQAAAVKSPASKPLGRKVTARKATGTKK